MHSPTPWTFGKNIGDFIPISMVDSTLWFLGGSEVIGGFPAFNLTDGSCSALQLIRPGLSIIFIIPIYGLAMHFCVIYWELFPFTWHPMMKNPRGVVTFL